MKFFADQDVYAATMQLLRHSVQNSHYNNECVH